MARRCKRWSATTRCAPPHAHVGIIGHITKDELLRYLTATELANGFFNRFLLIAVERVQAAAVRRRARRARARRAPRRRSALALRFAGTDAALTFDAAARERWIDIYAELSAGQPGLAGAATGTRRSARRPPRADLRTPRPLRADPPASTSRPRSAVWRYSADSARWVFGDSLGDPTADEIWAAAKERPAGITRTEVSRPVLPQQESREIDRALTVLEDAGRLRRETSATERGDPPRSGCRSSLTLPDPRPGRR